VPIKIKVMGYFEIVTAVYFLLVTLDLIAITQGSFIQPGAVFVYFLLVFQLVFGALLLKGNRYAPSVVFVYSILRSFFGVVFIIYGFWMLFTFIKDKEIRAYTGIPAESSP